MSKYTPTQLKRMAALALAAKERGDFQYKKLLTRIVIRTGWSFAAVTDSIRQLAQ